MAFLVLKASICVLVFPIYRLHSSASLCLGLSSPPVSIRICSFVSSALQLFASTASAECLCPRVFGCARFITGHVVTPSSFVHACVLVSGVVICHVSLARRTCQFWYLSSIWIYVLSLALSHFSRLFLFRGKLSFAHVYENLISIFAIDLLDQNLTSFYIPK